MRVCDAVTIDPYRYVDGVHRSSYSVTGVWLNGDLTTFAVALWTCGSVREGGMGGRVAGRDMPDSQSKAGRTGLIG